MNQANPQSVFQRMGYQMLLLLVILSPLMNVSSVLAAAPQPSLTRAPSPLIGFGLMFLMAVIVVSITFIPSKRSHLD